MHRLLNITATILIVTSCSSPTKDQLSGASKQPEKMKETKIPDELFSNLASTENINADSQETTTSTSVKAQKNKIIEQAFPIRYIEFPGDANFNGKAMVQQEEIPRKVFEKFPDTLSCLAIERYKTYDYYFPKSIADNFEDGISVERVVYPNNLIFRFQLFEDESSLTPYITKEITVTRKQNGELYTE